MLTRDSILQAADLPVAEVQVDEWGGAVHVRTLNAQERVDMAEWTKPEETDRAFLSRFCALVLCDANGQRLFADTDAPILATKNPHALETVLNAALRHNKMRTEDREDAGKNSETAPT